MYVFITIIHVDLLFVICFVYMGDNTNYLISLLFNKTENVMYIKMYMSFYSENSLLLFYFTRIRVCQSNMKV